MTITLKEINKMSSDAKEAALDSMIRAAKRPTSLALGTESFKVLSLEKTNISYFCGSYERGRINWATIGSPLMAKRIESFDPEFLTEVKEIFPDAHVVEIVCSFQIK